MGYPTRLAKSPLIEAVFEVRFAPVEGRRVEQLLGLLYQRLARAFGAIEQLPIGGVPKQLREQRPELRYAAQFKFTGDGQAVMFGDCVLSVNVIAPYPGWARFRERCVQVVGALRETGHVDKLERFSLKY